MEIVRYHEKENLKRTIKESQSGSSKTSEESSLTLSLPEIDIFAGNFLVESPRKLLFEKTQLNPGTSLTEVLEDFYAKRVVIPEKRMNTLVQRATDLVDYIKPRIVKFAQQIGMKIESVKYSGSMYDDSMVVRAKAVDILVEFECTDTKKLQSSEAGFILVPLKKYCQKIGEPPDPQRFARSEDGKYLLSMTTALHLHDLLQKALKLHPIAKLEPFVIEEGQRQITVNWKKTMFHLTPCMKAPDEDYQLVSQPYVYDKHVSDRMLWRVSCKHKEKMILETMDLADRGVRRKAFKILKALVKLEHTLHGLTSYHIKTLLFHAFDCVVDVTPRWQRVNLETSFMTLLEELHHFLSIRSLPHFFFNEYNLFGYMEARKLQALESRIGYLLNSPNELVRVLKKHTPSTEKETGIPGT